MRMKYASDAHAAYLAIEDDVADGSAVENVVIERPGRGDIVPDFDADGRLLAVELIGATGLLRGCRRSHPDLGSMLACRRRQHRIDHRARDTTRATALGTYGRATSGRSGQSVGAHPSGCAASRHTEDPGRYSVREAAEVAGYADTRGAK